MTVFTIIYIFGAIGGAIACAESIEHDGKRDNVPAWFLISCSGVFWITILIGTICHMCLEYGEK